jgi:ABC-type multidrug transport system fused ATPase/permease subunit
MRQNKIWPVLRDVIIVTVLSCLGGFIVGSASTSGHNSPLYIYSLALSNGLLLTIGFTISGCLAVENRWRHLAFVGAIVWLVSIFNVIFFGLTFIQWAASVIAIAIFALIGGGISLLFKRKTLVEISSNFNDEKFYEEVARELQDKPMVRGLWTKAFAEMGGDDAKARAQYIKFRVAQLAEASRQELEKERIAKQQQERPKRIRKIKIFAEFILYALFVWIAVQVLWRLTQGVFP